jgi:arabinan endo-1,5-alpha-L-arabinosidase
MACLLAGPACRGNADVVASSVGDYDPGHPPQVVTLTGSLLVGDPYAIRAEKRVWLFSSGPGIPARSSPDMALWQNEQPLFAQNPGWIANVLPAVTDLWSPSMVFFGGRYHLYYAASTFGSDKGDQ